MRKKLAMKICAIAMTAAMVASLAGCGNNDSGDSGSGSASGSGNDSGNTDSDNGDSGEVNSGEVSLVKDLGGVTIRVNGGIWSDLNNDDHNSTEYVTAWDRAETLQKMYNIKIEYVDLPNDSGYDTATAIQTTILNGECFADLFTVDDQVTVALIDYLAEVPDPDKLEWGSIYLEPATWGGKTIGFSYDNIGNTYAMVYSREYLKNVAGMDVTPTEKFLAGEWDYEAFKEYLTQLKAKLPAGTYPIAIHPYHWASMAPAANGVVSVDSDMNVHLTDDAYIDAMEFYKELVELGLAAPTGNTYTVEGGGIGYNEGEEPVYGIGSMCTATETKSHVITMAEGWQMGDLYTNLSGEWGIVPWPWSTKYVTCEGDYTTLSENYRITQSIWTNMVAPQKEYRGKGNAAEIDDMDLYLVARDWCDLTSTNAANVRHAAWEAEKNGTEYVNYGFDPGKIGSFSTTEDAALYDWFHSRVIIDWGHSMQQNGIVRVNRSAVYVLSAGYDARTAGETWQQEGEQNIADRWK